MKTLALRLFGVRLMAGMMAVLLFASQLPVQASDIKVDIRLIWGSNEAKSPNKNHKPVDEETAKKLRNMFKWKHYFEVKKLNETIPNRATKRIKVSDKCEIEVTEMEGPKVEVKQYGEGKLIHKITQNLQKGESIVLGGDDKNETAWFVLITLVE